MKEPTRFGETLADQWSLFADWLLTQEKFVAFMISVPLPGGIQVELYETIDSDHC